MKKILLLSVVVSSVALAGTQEKVGRYFTDEEYRKEAQVFAKKHGFEIPEIKPDHTKTYGGHDSSVHGMTPEIKKVSYNDESLMHSLPYKNEMRALPVMEPKREMRALPVEEQESAFGYQVLSPDDGVIGYEAETIADSPVRQKYGNAMSPVRQMDTDYMVPSRQPVRQMDTDYMNVEISE